MTGAIMFLYFMLGVIVGGMLEAVFQAKDEARAEEEDEDDNGEEWF